MEVVVDSDIAEVRRVIRSSHFGQMKEEPAGFKSGSAYRNSDGDLVLVITADTPLRPRSTRLTIMYDSSQLSDQLYKNLKVCRE